MDDIAIQFVGFLPPEGAVGDYAAVAQFRVGGERLLVTVSITLAAVMATRVGPAIDWLDYPPLAALGYLRIEEMLDGVQTASEIPLIAEDANELLAFDRAWREGDAG